MTPGLNDNKIIASMPLAQLYDDHHYNTLTSLKGFLGALTSASCVSKATITRDNIAAVVSKRTATNTKPPIGPTDSPTSCARIVNVTFMMLPVSNATVQVSSMVDPRTKIIAPSVRRYRNARSVALTYVHPNPSRIIVAGTLIVTPVNNKWTLNPMFHSSSDVGRRRHYAATHPRVL